MKLSDKGLAFIAKEEGLRLKAYQDSVGVWTIGYGSTRYEDGSKVRMGDTITRQRAENLFRNTLKVYENGVNGAIKRAINQNQFDALVSLCYNIGVAGFSRSTVARKVNADPCDTYIRHAFEMWRNAGTHKGILLDRRKREADLYFS